MDERTHETVVVTAKDLTANKCKSRVGATVSSVFSDEFERKVKWVKTDKQGNIIEEEDATETNEELVNGDGDQGDDNTQGNGGQQQGGSGDNGAGGGME